MWEMYLLLDYFSTISSMSCKSAIYKAGKKIGLCVLVEMKTTPWLGK